MGITGKRKPRPPSRLRYAAAHPTIGVTVDEATHSRLDEQRHRLGLSFAQILLGNAETVEHAWEQGVEEGGDLGYEEGYEVGRAESQAELAAATGRVRELEARVRELESERVTFPCDGCGGPVVLWAGSGAEAAVVSYLRANGWGHARCIHPEQAAADGQATDGRT